MPSFDISEQNIRALAYNAQTYGRGLAYYRAGRVHNFSYDPEQGQIKAKVHGVKPYSIELILLKNGLVYTYQCTCSAFKEYPGACKHIIAVLKYAQQKVHSVKPAVTDQSNPLILQHSIQATEDLIGHFANYIDAKEPGLRNELTLRLELQLTTDRRPAFLQLRIGLQRLYIIKDIEQFLNAVRTGQILEFGKQFTYDPSRHSFSPDDGNVINMLQEMYTQYNALNETHDFYLSGSLFNQKSLALSKYYLGKLFDALGNKEFNLSVDSAPEFSARIQREGLPLEFSLQARDQDLALMLAGDVPPFQLTPDGRYYFFRKTIYLATPGQQEFFPPLLKTFHKKLKPQMLISAKQKERFASEVLPYIQKAGPVSVDPNLTGKFCHEELHAKIYFDRGEHNGMTARLEFHYGDTVINPFSSKEDARSTPASGDMILIRASEQEREILSIFEQADFTVSQGKIQLDGNEKIFDFTVKWLPQLQSLAEVFYSDEFKLKLRTATAFSGRIRLDESLDMLEISFQYGDIDPAELSDVFHALQMKKHYHRLRDGSFLDLNQPEFDLVARLLDNLNLKAADLDDKTLHLPKYRAMYIDSFLRQTNLPGIHRNRAFKQLVQSILEPQDSEFEVPAELEPVMRGYQKTGFKWLKTLASLGLGGILADDMGLGKTLQVLSFILSEKAADPSSFKPALVISPTSLIYNWREEGEKFAPSLKILVIDGNPQEREAQLTDFAAWDVVVVSYPILRRDIAIFAELDFSSCFLDEAQHIKNPQTLNAKSVQQIKAKSYFALTGTPIENSLSELWSLFNCIMPGYLLSHQDFHQKYEKPIVKGEEPQLLTELGRHIAPFVLRRLKKDVLRELPDKIETQMSASLTTEQKKVYLAYLQQARAQIAQELAAAGFAKSQMKILAALTRLRQICCHPSMFLEDYGGGSGKMDLFKEILTDALDSGHRLLVFSQFTTMLEIIQNYLVEEKIAYFYLHGSTKANERSHMARSFNEGQGQVFLISLKAGGTGLNLTGADTVIHFDPWWNPAVEEQATDRAYRIGQTNTVQVIKLITQGTIEEKVNLLQVKKKKLIDAVIQPGETMLAKLSEQELRDLFDL